MQNSLPSGSTNTSLPPPSGVLSQVSVSVAGGDRFRGVGADEVEWVDTPNQVGGRGDLSVPIHRGKITNLLSGLLGRGCVLSRRSGRCPWAGGPAQRFHENPGDDAPWSPTLALKEASVYRINSDKPCQV